MELLNISEPSSIFRAAGCQFCNQTGYKGRAVVHEILYLDNNLKSKITADMKAEDIRKLAIDAGMVELNESCRKLVLDGITDMPEYMSINVE